MRRHPALGLAGRKLHGAVHHLHAGVRQERRGIDGIDSLRSFADCLERIAILPIAIGGCGVEAFLEHLRDRRARLRRPCPLIPDDRQRVERLLGAPPGIGDDSDGGVLYLHHLLHAGHAGDLLSS